MYGGIYFNKNKNKIENYVKIKGLTKTIPFSSLVRLLFKNNHLSITHEKWIRDIENSTIKVNKNTPHTLKLSSFKR